MSNQKNTRRGYVDTDAKEFSSENLLILQKAQMEVHWFLDRGYPIKNVVTFIGDHYLLSNRQRLALMRSTSTTASLAERKNKEVTTCENQTIHIDGFNLIITLEVALSSGTLIKCMDGTVRDLAGLRGTYRLIDKTDVAISLIGKRLQALCVAEAIFYLDAPVSNSGRLKERIFQIICDYGYKVRVDVVNNPDALLKSKANVVTSDAIILNDCTSWVNMGMAIISDDISGVEFLELEG